MQQPFKDLLATLRAGRHQPYCSCSSCEMYQAERWEKACNIVTWFLVLLAFGMVVLFCGVSQAMSHKQWENLRGLHEGSEKIKCSEGTPYRNISHKHNWFCGADYYSLEEWADAIYKAENSKTHPYGIMVKYRHTSPRNACKNTVARNWRDYSKLPVKTRQSMPFVTWLSRHYAPIGVSNDPQGLNKNWIKNVEFYLKKG